MSLDGKIMRRARDQLQAKRSARGARQRSRQQAVYASIPRVREIDQALRAAIADTIQVVLKSGGDPESQMERISNRSLALQREREALLSQKGYPKDYLDDKPDCPICSDTGYTRRGICPCLMSLYKSLQAEELSNLLNLTEENFDAFSLDYYDDRTIHPVFGITARQNMEYNFELCKTYAATFRPDSPNLFLVGDTGLGKTFLSSCIAKAISETGRSVVYDSASIVFAKFQQERYEFKPEEALQSEINRYLECDLLILDDLGTEVSSSFTVSTLYTLVNTRLIRGKKMIISSNYDLDTLGKRYSPQIMSRLRGEFEILTFFGEDIRQLKKRQKLD